VTIALGILTHDAVVIAADTQIGADYLKTGHGKISWGRVSSGAGQGAMAITGSGTTAYLDHIQKDFVSLFAPNKPVMNADDFHQHASEYLVAFYSDHVIPFSSYGSERPSVDILIGYSDGNKSMLLASEHNVLTQYGSYHAIGAGAMDARILFNRIFLSMWPLSMRSAMLLAAYVVFNVKECVDGCGKDTDIVVITRDQVIVVGRDKINAMELVFRSCLTVEANMLRAVFQDEQTLTGSGGGLSRDLRKLRGMLSKVMSV